MSEEFVTDAVPVSRQGASGRLVIALVLLSFICGLAAMAWAFSRWNDDAPPVRPPADVAPSTDPLASPGDNAMAGGPGAQRPMLAYTPATIDTQTARVMELEQRLTRVAVAAQAASGYASRAEAMLVAFAARRALDAGAPLDRIEGQLRLLFGQAQPRAVATIVNAAAQPVTLSTLRAGLDQINGTIARGNAGEGWWSAFRREVGGLVVVRQAGTPSASPEARLTRARLNVETGQLDAAIVEVEALGEDPAIETWLEQARRYNEAHRALDVIEAAALLEARATPVVQQVAPPVLQNQSGR